MIRRSLAAACLIALAAPVSSGQASEHCADADLIFFTRYTTEIENPTSGAPIGNPSLAPTLACSTFGDGTPEQLSDTRYIYPWANSFSIRWGGDGVPVSGTVTFPWETFEFAAEDFPADSGFPTTAWTLFREDGSASDSQSAGTSAEIELCLDTGDCITTTYRTFFG